MGIYTGTVPSLLAGELADADKTVNITDLMTALTASWTPYTPAWTASAGTPDIGNGVLSGAYRQIGKTIDWRLKLLAGSTTTFGTGGAYWSFTLPAVAAADFAFAGIVADNGVTVYNVGTYIAGGVDFIYPYTAIGVFTNTSAFTFADGDFFLSSGTYECV